LRDRTCARYLIENDCQYQHQIEVSTMARVCQVTGATPGFGHAISHSHRRTKRRFNVNVQSKTYWVPSLVRKVTLTVSARGIKVIDRRGIDAVVAEIIKRDGSI
jgi:large subunit ribosomal protein L28